MRIYVACFLLTAEFDISAQEPICAAAAPSQPANQNEVTNTIHIFDLLDHTVTLARRPSSFCFFLYLTRYLHFLLFHSGTSNQPHSTDWGYIQWSNRHCHDRYLRRRQPFGLRKTSPNMRTGLRLEKLSTLYTTISKCQEQSEDLPSVYPMPVKFLGVEAIGKMLETAALNDTIWRPRLTSWSTFEDSMYNNDFLS